jgi:hypothetical protein
MRRKKRGAGMVHLRYMKRFLPQMFVKKDISLKTSLTHVSYS